MKLPQFPVLFGACRTPLRSTSGERILKAAIVPVTILLSTLPAQRSRADAIFTPTDQILGGREITTDPLNLQFAVGTGNGAVGSNSWPNAESPNHAIDGVGQKYLNFGITYTGFLVAPSFNGGNGSVASSMQIWTANDAEARDPASYEIWGTNAALDFSATTFSLSSFSKISEGLLTLPSTRNAAGTTALNSANSQTVSFANATGYSKYLIVFPTVKTSASANSMQVAEVQLFGVAAFTSLKWTGANSAIWNVGATQNFSVAGSPSTYSDTNGVTFDDTANSTRTNITVQNGGTGVKPAVVIFQNNTLNYTIGGEAIVSPGSLAFNGTGTVTLNNVNNFTNGTTVSAGTVNVGPAGTLGTGALTVNNLNAGNGTAVALNFNSAQTVGSLSGAVATPATGTNTATIGLSGTFTVTQAADATFSGTIAGTGGLTKEGLASLTLNGSNTYAGPTIVNNGTLRSSAPGDNPKGALPSGQPVTVNSGGNLVLGADDGLGYYSGSVSSLTVNGGQVVTAAATHSTVPALTLNGGTLTAADAGNFSNGAVLNYILDGTVTTVASNTTSRINAPTILLRNDQANTGVSTPLTFNVPRGTAAVDLAVNSVILDQGAGLIKSGAGILRLTNANGYTGPTVVNAGTLAVANSAALGSGAVTLNNGATLSLEAATALNGFSTFSLNGGASLDNSTLQLTSNATNQTRSAFSLSQVPIDKGFTAEFIYTSGGNRAADGITFTVQNDSPTALGGGGGALGYTGILNSAAVKFNLYTGQATPQPVGTNYATSANNPATYIASAPVNLASGNPISVTLQYDPQSQTLSELLVDLYTRATYTNVFTSVDIAGAIGSTSGYVGFTGATGGAVSSQTVGNFSFTNSAQGVAVTNSIGIASNASATIAVPPSGAGGAGFGSINGQLTIANGATLNVTGGSAATNTPYLLNVIAPGKITGNATINVANNGTAEGRVAIQDIGDTATGATLTKTGVGTLVIGGAASYTGVTTVNAGTLLVNGSVAGSTTVNGNATLGGTGTLASVNVASGGTLAPGNGVGTITSGPLSLASGSTFRLEIGATTGDQARVLGTATIAGTVNLQLALTSDPTDGTAFKILDSNAPIAGFSSGARLSYLGTTLNQNQVFTVTDGAFSQVFSINYGEDIVLTAVPEPAAVGSLLIGMTGLLGLRRRRR